MGLFMKHMTTQLPGTQYTLDDLREIAYRGSYDDMQRSLARALLAVYEQEPVANSEAAETLHKICNIFRIGIQAQTQSTILANVENAVRFADQLHAIEREFFMVPGEPDEDYPEDEPADVCLVNCWGATTERYVEQFRAALIRVAHPAPSIPVTALTITDEQIDALLDSPGNLSYVIADKRERLRLFARAVLDAASPSIPAAVPDDSLARKVYETYVKLNYQYPMLEIEPEDSGSAGEYVDTTRQLDWQLWLCAWRACRTAMLQGQKL